MVFGPSERDHGTQNQFFLILETPKDIEEVTKITNAFLKISIFGNLKILNIASFVFVGEGADQRIPKIFVFLKILHTGSISSRKHESENLSLVA